MTESNACPFCDPRSFAGRLIFENEKFCVIATLGQMAGGYVLLFPKRHVRCLGELSGDEARAAETLLQDLRRAMERAYGRLPEVFFEHGIVGQSVEHAHLHCVPVPAFLVSRALRRFGETFAEASSSLVALRIAYAERPRPYLFVHGTGDGPSYVFWNPPAPKQYFRTELADALGHPEWADWRSVDPDLDWDLIRETKRRLEGKIVAS